MHELSICQEMLSQVTTIASDKGASAVDKIIVIIGPLSGVEVPLLERAFSVARGGTVAANAILESIIGPIIVCCRSCGDKTHVAMNSLICGVCGDWNVDVVEGEELILKTVELSGICTNVAGQPLTEIRGTEQCVKHVDAR